MRIDASQVLGQGGVKIKVGIGTAADSLKEGDVVRAEVISSDKNGLLSLKMENGQSFNAKLGTDVKLSPGEMILLEVTSRDGGQVTLSFKGVESADDDLSLGQKNLVADFTDKSLATFASKLSELNMPVTEESARMMREIIAQNPNISLNEAAFLASNKLTGDASLMKAALEAFATGDKTDAMIARLIALAGEQTSPADNPSEVRGVNTAQTLTVNTANAAPLTELLTTVVKSFSNVFSAPVQTEQASVSSPQTIITQPNVNMQTNAENAQEIFQSLTGEALGQGEASGRGDGSYVPSGVVGQGDGSSVPTGIVGQENGSSVPSGVVGKGDGSSVPSEVVGQGDGSSVPSGVVGQGDGSSVPQGVGQGDGSSVPQGADASQTTQNIVPTSPATQTTQAMSSVVAQLLSDIPEFSGTPQSALHRFSEMLLRVAGENPETTNNKETLMAQLDKLFTKISRNDTDAGARLRDARQELYARLALIEEAVSNASQPARAEMLVQTQKLMDHVRLLNSIEQFVYMQLPVQLSEEKKTADLYVFKRKGGKRADPDNVNILMAIDLEFMGHWEALINIKNKDVSIQMEVPGESQKEHFNANTVLLHNMLNDAGFKLVSTNIKFSIEETTPLTALSTFDRHMGGKQGIIDFKI